MDINRLTLLCFVCQITLLLYLTSPAHSAPSIQDYGNLPSISKVAISPDGEHFAYRQTSKKRDAVLVHSIKTGKLVKGVDVSNIDPNHVYFHSNDHLILMVSQYKKLMNYREAMNIGTAYSYNFRKGEVKALINPGQALRGKAFIYPGQEGMGRIIGRSEDNKHVFMPAYVASSPTDLSPNYALLKVATDGKRKPKIFDRGSRHTTDFFMDNQGNLLARESYRKNSQTHLLESKVNGKWKVIYKEKTELQSRSFVGLTEDSKNMVFLAYEKNNDFLTHYSMSLTDGKIAKLPFDKPGTDVEAIETTVNKVALGLRYSGFTPSYRFFNDKLQKRVEAAQAQFPDQSVRLMDWSANFNDLIFKVEGSTRASDFFLFSENKEPRFIASARPNIKVEDINFLGQITYKARDGRPIPTLLTIPRAKVDDLTKLPAVLMPHGGPASYDAIGFNFMAQALASRGYLVIQPQFRGSNGFGWEHEKAGHGEWGKKMQDDLTDSIEFLTRKGIVDPNRICIAGASYGGYAALAGATFTPNTYKCAFSLAGVSHVPHMLRADKRLYGKRSRVLSYFKLAIGGGDFDKQELKDISPYYFAKNVKIPVMLVHGEDDKIVEYKQSKLMYSALKKAGANVKLIKLNNEDHHLQDQETRLQAVKALVNFVDQHIGVSN